MSTKIFLAATIVLLAPFQTRAAEQLVPTELWVTGDDGLTQRFAQSLRASLAKSKVLRESTANSNSGLALTIPRNVYWQDVNGNTNFEYVVIFTDKSSRYLGVGIGPCWEKGMGGCATTVIEAAERAWAQRPSNGA